jgi:hypothetical protein
MIRYSLLKEQLENPTLRTEKGSTIKRSSIGVGKDIGGHVYLHKQYEDHIPDQEGLAKAKKVLAEKHPDHNYNTIKWGKKDESFTFIHSHDFDSAHEPTSGKHVTVDKEGKTRTGESDQIWHHKWLWVKHDYKGFDVNKSVERSKKWLKIPNIEYSKIGRRHVWEKDYVPKIEEEMDNTREKYINGELINEGDIVVHKNNKTIHEVLSCGTNYITVADQQGEVTKMWITDAVNANSLKEDFNAARRRRSSSNQIAYCGYKTINFDEEIYSVFHPMLKENHDKFLLLSLIRSTDQMLSEENDYRFEQLFEYTDKILDKLNTNTRHNYRQKIKRG